jgi:phenylacetate-CoA ligase
VSTWPPSGQADVPPLDQRYWADEETMAPEERAKVVLQKLRGQIQYAWDHSVFYRRLWGEAGVGPGDLKNLADLAQFPLVTKQHLRDDQAEHPPFGSNLCCDPAEIGRIHGSSGTTGRSTMFVLSRDDWARIGAAHARIMWSFGVRPQDIIFIGSFFSLYLGSWGALAGAEVLGCRAFPFGAGVPGQTVRALEFLQLVRPQVFYGTPSYALHLAKTADTRDVDPSKLGFQIMFFSGEPGAGIPATKRRIEETFDAICVDTGSMAEMTPWMTNAECDERLGMHLWDDIVYTEILDPETHEPIAEDGEGIPVYTHLERTSQPMIRLFSGDLTRVTSEPCPCGRTYRRLPEGVYGRVDDMLIIRGVNVYPHSVEDALANVPGVGSEYRIVIERPEELDVFSLEIESDDPNTAAAVRERVKLTTGIAPKVTVHPLHTLESTEFKSRRIVDRRNARSSHPAA